MTEPNSSLTDQPLNPTAPSFAMPAESASGPASTAAAAKKDTTTNGTTADNKQKQNRPEIKSGTTEQDIAEAGAGVKLTGAQLKKQKAAEKAARRSNKVAERGAEAMQPQQPNTQQGGAGQPSSSTPSQPPSTKKEGLGPRRESMSGGRQLPVRSNQAASKETTAPKDKVLDKRVPMLSHLYPSQTTRRVSLSSAGREIHPAVLSLGLQYRDYVICGSNARTVAMLLVFKKVIQAYSTPAGVAMSRHLVTHLSHQISYLTHARQLNVPQGNSIRWLKKLIAGLDPDLNESDAKPFLCRAIDVFIQERFTLADQVISKEASARIDEGDVILTYGKSSVVEKTFLTAHRQGKKFKVIVVDSRPLFEGKNMVQSLMNAGLGDVQYCLLNGLGEAMEQEGITKCYLGASAMFGNGRLSSRAGTFMVAMMAKEGSGGGGQGRGKVPVIVLCESIKFTSKVALDSITSNEVGDGDVLVPITANTTLSQVQSQPKPEPTKKGGKPSEETVPAKKGLEGWKDQPNLFLVNLMYDVTPAEHLDMVISELGILPPSAVLVVHGVHGGDE